MRKAETRAIGLRGLVSEVWSQRPGLRDQGAIALAWVCAAWLQSIVLMAQSVPGKPIIVSIPPDKPKSELSGLADVLLGSLGLTGIIVVAAVLLGAVMAGVMFWARSRDGLRSRED
jgi:ABC-type phosphate transport system permease subunit